MQFESYSNEMFFVVLNLGDPIRMYTCCFIINMYCKSLLLLFVFLL